jgi:hypothetical protein
MPEPALDRHAELIDREVLREVVEGAVLDRGDGRLDGRERGNENDREGRIHLARSTQHLHPVHARHLEVGQQQVGSLRVDQRERAVRVGRGQALISRSLQDAGAVLDHVRLVVENQHPARRHARSPGWAL